MTTEIHSSHPTREDQVAYWRLRLSGELPVLNLALDYPRPPVSSFVREREQMELGQALYQKLTNFSAQHDYSLFVILLTTLKILLLRYTGENDIIVGGMPAGVHSLDRFVGKEKEWINNLVALRTNLADNLIVSQVLSRVADTVREAVAHGQYPLQEVLQNLGKEKSIGSLPFKVMFEMEEKRKKISGAGKSETPSHMFQEFGVQCDFIIKIFTKQRFVVQVEYDAELFESATMSRMLGHYRNLLESMVTGSGKRLSDLTLLTETERRQLLLEWNQTAADYPGDTCIHLLFEDQVALTPENVAVVFADNQVTYWELNRRANRLAHHLQKLGVGPETLVGLYMERSIEMVVGLLGILKAGGAYVPLDPGYPTERLKFMLQDTAIQALVTQSDLRQRLPIPGQVVCLDEDREVVEMGIDRNPVGRAQFGNLAYVMLTSGSTGQPKGVCVEHSAVIRLVKGASYVTFSSEDVYLHLAPLAFDASTFEIWGALLHSARLVLLPAGQPTLDEIGEAIRQNQVTTLWLTAGLFHVMVLERIDALKSLRHLLAGGDVLSVQYVEQARRELNHCRLVNGYGPTEGTTFSCCYEIPLNEAMGDTVPIGRPISNTTIYIVNAHGQLIPIGVRGELYIGGNGLARGYWRRPELTACQFVPHPFAHQPGARLYKTGDGARYRPDGNIEFLGRRDHQVKIRGYRIELSEIEATLEQQASVKQAIVLAREDAPGDKRLVAYIISSKDKAPSSGELRAALAAGLPDYMIPSLYVVLDAFPLTPNGKVDRKVLPPPEWKQIGRTEMLATPRTHTEKKLAEIWAQILGVERISILDHFFFLGGHSLLAMRLTTRIHRVFGVNLPIEQIFETPTLEELSKRIEALPVGSEPLLPSQLTEPVRVAQFPASYAQERMWFLQQSTPNSAVYNQSFAFRILGDLQVEALRRSLQALEERHDPLRTTFALLGDQVEQHVQPASEFPLPLEDLSPMSSVAREDRWQAMASQEASRLFDLSKGPLWRGRLVRLSDTEHVLLLTFHHICMDEWSLRIFREELSELYAAFAVGKTIRLAPLPSRYVDYAQWQRQWLASRVADNQLEYWRTKLGRELSVLNLPTDYPRLSAPNERGATERRLLSSSLLERLKKLSGEQEMTLFMTLLGAFQVLLSRYSGQDDIVVGTPIANRDLSHFQGLVGLLLNTMVMRCDLSGQPTVRETLTRVRKMALEAYTHRNVPFEKVVQVIRGLREGSTAPLFQIMFVLQNLEEHAIPLGSLETILFPVSRGTAKCDLTLFLAAKPEGLQAVMEYRTDLFESTTIQQMLGNLEVLLEGIVSDPETRIGELPLLAESERHQALVEWNQTTADYPRDTCIHQLFEAQVARTPEAVAVVCENQQITYQELNERANQLAHYLQTLGVGPEVRVALYCERSLELLVALWGIVKAGGTYVPIDPTYPQERVAMMLQNASVAVVVAQQHGQASLPPHSGQVVWIDTEWPRIQQNPKTPPPLHVAPDNLAYMIYTSGSTGTPKGVQVPHRTLVNFLDDMAREPGLIASDRLLAVTSLSFDIAGLELWLPVLVGGQVVLASREMVMDGAQLMAALETHGITVMQGTPATWQLLVTQGWKGHPGLRLLCGGEQMPLDLAHQLGRRSHGVWNLYGPTETTVWSTRWKLPHEVGRISIGRPIANTHVYVEDPWGHLVPIGVPGELFIGGEGVARGYWGRPDVTAERFAPNPYSRTSGARRYRTGDEVRYRADGQLEWLARLDQQIKLRGYRIELGEIESVLTQHPDVRNAVVLCREDAPGDKQLVAYVVSTSETPLEPATLRPYLKTRLPDYMLPVAFVVLNAFPLMPNGKVNRRALPVPDPTHRTRATASVPPRTPIEELVADIWRDILKVEPIGVNDNFFELGGHSLLATRLLEKLRGIGQSDLPLRTLFEHPILEDQALAIEEHLLKEIEDLLEDEFTNIEDG